MIDVQEGFERPEERFVAWAKTRADIRAALVIGSRARTDLPADEWAELDIGIFVDDPAVYIADPDWPQEIGDVVLTHLEPTAAGGGMERRVLFSGGLDVDFAVFPWSVVSATDLENPGTELRNSLGRGVRVIVDKEGLLSGLEHVSIAPPEPEAPSPSEFLQVVSDYLYHVLWTAKHLRRGEVWWARGGLEGRLNGLMRTMLEWHASFAGDGPRDTWFRGRFLEQWADPQVVARLPDATSRYDSADVARALPENHRLFMSLATAVAGRLGYEYPADADAEVTRLAREVLAK